MINKSFTTGVIIRPTIDKNVFFTMSDLRKNNLRSGEYIILKHGNKKTIGIAYPGSEENNVVIISQVISQLLEISINEIEKNEIKIEIEKNSSYTQLKSNTVIINTNTDSNLTEYNKKMIIDYIKTNYHGFPLINTDTLYLTYEREVIVDKKKEKIKEKTPFELQFRCNNKEFILISKDSEFVIIDYMNELELFDKNIESYNMIIEDFHDNVFYPLLNIDELLYMNIKIPRSIFFFGSSRNVKKRIVDHMCCYFGVSFKSLSLIDIYQQFKLNKSIRTIIMNERKTNIPTIIYLEDIDCVFQNKKVYNNSDRIILLELYTTIKDLKPEDKIIVVFSLINEYGNENIFEYNEICDYQIIMDKLSFDDRYNILKSYFHSFIISDDVLRKTAELTNDYNDEKINQLVFHASKGHIDVPDNDEVMARTFEITIEDIKKAIEIINEIDNVNINKNKLNTPDIKLEDVIGLDEAKKVIEEVIVWRLKPPDILKEFDIPLLKGILLYGPSGCGKTMLCQAIANEYDCEFIYVKGPEIFSKWFAESHNNIKDIFQRAKKSQPCIIFVDEFDSIASKRNHDSDVWVTMESNKVVNQLLIELNGLEYNSDIIFIGATNRPDILDPAIIRSERIDCKVYVGLPNHEDRKKLFLSNLKKIKYNENIDFDYLSNLTEKYTGADISSIVKFAGIKLIRDGIEKKRDVLQIEEKDLIESIKKVKCSIDEDMLKIYEEFAKNSLNNENNIEKNFYS